MRFREIASGVVLCLVSVYYLDVESADHLIHVASARSGLSVHVIRIWEKRYGAVQPKRTGTNRRHYSDNDIERLTLLRRATEAGHNIGNVAALSTDDLRSLAGAATLRLDPVDSTSSAQRFHDECLEAVRKFDGHELDERLRNALVSLGHQGLLRQVAAPLAQSIGKLWRAGIVTAAHEHFLTASLKVFLGKLAGQFAASAIAPAIVIATPAGQLHELGAVMINTAAAQVGWRTTYLGASLPAAEIAGAAVKTSAVAVAISIVYPDDDPELAQELLNLGRFLPANVTIFSGGRAAASYLKALQAIRAVQLDDFETFSRQLDVLRRNAAT